MANVTLPPLQAMLDWLQGQPYSRIIGQRLAIEGCAIHTWLLTVFPGPIVVDEETVQVGMDDGTTVGLATPDAYRMAMEQLDYLGGVESAIRVDEARAALRDVLREYGED